MLSATSVMDALRLAHLAKQVPLNHVVLLENLYGVTRQCELNYIPFFG